MTEAREMRRQFESGLGRKARRRQGTERSGVQQRVATTPLGSIEFVRRWAQDRVQQADVATRFGISSSERPMSARHYMAQRLEDPLLSTVAIAAHVRVSTNQLRKDFERGGWSIGSHIREQRLERAAAMLRARHCDAIASSISHSRVAFAISRPSTVSSEPPTACLPPNSG
jgi:AraC-like DNA-binding protein